MTAPARDPGLQPERTALAWQRTALSLTAAAVVVGRLTAGVLGPAVIIVLAFSLAHSAVLFRAGRRRHAMPPDTPGSRDSRGSHSDAGGLPANPPGSVGIHGVLLTLQVILLALLESLALAHS